ncbi:MAG TPA: endonuclease/exonuclease/phosphatase family protein [Kofleriaceae bacterium]|jgi:predicted extracellular nuclease
MRFGAALLLLTLGACRNVDEPPQVDHPDAAPVVPHLRVATFNVRRFFDTVCDSGVCNNGAYEDQPTQEEFDARATQIAAAIRTMDADVIAVEEVESQACLDALIAKLSDVMPYGVLGESGFAASVDVGILSRTPIDSSIGHQEELVLPDGRVTTFARELLEVHTHTTDGTNLIMFAAHFKSKSSDDPARRLAEGQASARIVNDVATQNTDALVVMGGDLNDTPGSPALNALTVDGALTRVADDLPVDAQGTYRYHASVEVIDHLLLAPTTQTARRIPLSSHSWRPTGGGGWGGSDHYALSSDFALRQ